METVMERLQLQKNQRPAYTKYELSNLVKNKRRHEIMTKEQFAIKYNVNLSLLNEIEQAECAFNVPMYRACSEILQKPIAELTAIITDNMDKVDFRASDISDGVKQTLETANLIFDEILMQLKIGAR